MERKEYIANCIGRILASDIKLINFRQMELDLAEAVVIAARDGEAAAHDYMVQLSKDAESGKYSAASASTATHSFSASHLRTG